MARHTAHNRADLSTGELVVERLAAEWSQPSSEPLVWVRHDGRVGNGRGGQELGDCPTAAEMYPRAVQEHKPSKTSVRDLCYLLFYENNLKFVSNSILDWYRKATNSRSNCLVTVARAHATRSTISSTCRPWSACSRTRAEHSSCICARPWAPTRPYSIDAYSISRPRVSTSGRSLPFTCGARLRKATGHLRLKITPKTVKKKQNLRNYFQIRTQLTVF